MVKWRQRRLGASGEEKRVAARPGKMEHAAVQAAD